ncbi:MAG: VWA domain-containing protein [Alphaproteobacteria bacterium]
MTSDAENLARWRLILGRYAEPELQASLANPDAMKTGGSLSAEDQKIDQTLEFLYQQEYTARGFAIYQSKQEDASGSSKGQPEQTGAVGMGAPMPTIPEWITLVQELFPAPAREKLEADALDRYNMTEMLTDARVLEKLEPSEQLLTTMLSFKSHLSDESMAVLRRIVEKVVEDIIKRIKREIEIAVTGRRNRFVSSNLKRMQNFDIHRTIRSNLKNWDAEGQRIIADRLRFNARIKPQFPWNVMICVDQSGSMASSMIHAAVIAGILHALPSVSVQMVLFSTEVVDVSEHLNDPVELLMSAFLGGGTDIGKAVAYCGQQIMDPQRSIFALITDFCEGGPRNVLQAEVAAMVESGITCLGLAGLVDQCAAPWFDRRTADELAELGMQIGAFTPEEFGLWLGDIIN